MHRHIRLFRFVRLVFDLQIDFLHQPRLQHPAAEFSASAGLIKPAGLDIPKRHTLDAITSF